MAATTKLKDVLAMRIRMAKEGRAYEFDTELIRPYLRAGGGPEVLNALVEVPLTLLERGEEGIVQRFMEALDNRKDVLAFMQVQVIAAAKDVFAAAGGGPEEVMALPVFDKAIVFCDAIASQKAIPQLTLESELGRGGRHSAPLGAEQTWNWVTGGE